MKPPAAQRSVLVLLAGLLWSAVGLALLGAAISWLISAHRNIVAPALAGLAGGIVIYILGFSKLAAVNLARIYRQAPGKDKVCVFAFQNTRSYVIIVVMMLLGYTLRHLPISRVYLAPLYAAIGLGLCLSSLSYYHRLIKELC